MIVSFKYIYEGKHSFPNLVIVTIKYKHPVNLEFDWSVGLMHLMFHWSYTNGFAEDGLRALFTNFLTAGLTSELRNPLDDSLD